MLKPNVATCLNSSCQAEFRRMGDGKLFVEPLRDPERGQARRVVWLCSQCSRDHSLHYDDGRRQFVLTPRPSHGKRIA
jgi:hypothetical protein